LAESNYIKIDISGFAKNLFLMEVFFLQLEGGSVYRSMASFVFSKLLAESCLDYFLEHKIPATQHGFFLNPRFVLLAINPIRLIK
jgi:hypothetical protein